MKDFFNSLLAEFKGFGKARQVPTAVARYKDHVFDPDGAELGIIQTGLNGHDVPFLQQRARAADTRRFMDI